MNFIKKYLPYTFPLLALLLTACGGGGGGGGSADSTNCDTVDVTTLSSGAGGGFDVVSDGTNLYVTDNPSNKILKVVIATGAVTTLAGSGAQGSGDGTGAAATFYAPSGIAIDASGSTLYVTEQGGHKIRKVVIATGEVTTLAGSGVYGDADGVGTAATFFEPAGIATDGTNLYVADEYNYKIRKVVIATGQVTTLAGSGTAGNADGIGTAATFAGPTGIAIDSSHTNLYIADLDGNTIRKVVIATGAVTTLAGSGLPGSADGTGTAATFTKPWGIATDDTNLYVTDDLNQKIRKIVIATGAVTTLAGSGLPGTADGTGATAQFSLPAGIAIDPASGPGDVKLYVTDYGSENIRKIQVTAGVCAGPAGYTVGGDVSGLNGTLVLQNNGADDKTITANGAFTFATTVASDGRYDVTVKTQPTGQTCYVSHGGGVATADVSNIAVSCATPPTVTSLTTNDNTPILTGTFDPAQATGGLTVTVNGQTYTSGVTTSGNTWSLQWMGPLSDNTYDVVVATTDSAGHTTTTTATGALVIDTAPPATPTVNTLTTTNTTPTLSGTFDAADAAGGFSVNVHGKTYTLGTDAALTHSGNNWSLTIPATDALTPGTYEVIALATDAAGNGAIDASTNELVVSGVANVAVQLQVSGSESQVGQYVLTLKQNGSTVAMTGNPGTLAPPAPVSTTFASVPDGTNYTIEADAFASCGPSVATAVATSASFDIVNGVIVNSGTATTAASPIPLALTLQSGTANLTVQVSGGAGGSEQAGASLLNLASFSAATLAAASVAVSPTDLLFSSVDPGATTGTSHRLFYYFADSTTGQATVAKSQDVAGNCVGTISTTQIGLGYSMTQAPTAASGMYTSQGAVHTGGFGHTYFYESSAGNFLREDGGMVIDISGGGMAIPINPVSVFTVTPLNGHDTVFYFDADDNRIKRNDDQGMISPTDVLDLTGNVTAMTAMAADANGAVYWLDNGNVWKLPANISSPTFANAVEIINTGTVTDLAVDAFGNLYYAIGNALYKASLGTANGTDYAAGTLLHTGTAVAAPGLLSVDAVGNLYFQDGSAANNLKMIAAGNGGTVYNVVGTSAITVSYPSVGADGTLYYVDATTATLMKL